MKTIFSPILSTSYFLLRVVFSCLFFTASLFLKSELIYAQCPALTPIELPFLENFEQIADTVLIESSSLCATDRVWGFETAVGFAQFGKDIFVEGIDGGALFLFSPGELDPNLVTLTLDMSNYAGTANVLLNFDFLNVGGDVAITDSVWIRGSNTNAWVGLYKWTPHNEHAWLTTPDLNISTALTDAGQVFSNNFQIRFGREGTFGLPSLGAAPELILDNIRLLTCLKPTHLTATNITTTSATLGWTEPSDAMNWNIEWGPKGFTQGSGAEEISFLDNSFELTDLTANTDYDFYVRSSCIDGFTDWAGPFTFKTFCAPPIPVTLPFLEDFELFENFSSIQFVANNSICDTNYNWTYETIGGRAIFGTGFFFSSSGRGSLLLTNNIGFSTNNVTLTLDMSNYTNEDNVLLSFDFYNIQSQETLNDSIWIRGSETDTWIGFHNLPEHSEGVWQNFREVDLGAILSKEGQSFSPAFQIRFGQDKHVSNFFDGFALDNILINTCAKPSNLKAKEVTSNSAELSWTELGTVANWEIEWGAKDFLRGNGIKTNIDTTSYNLSNLIPATSYDFYVRADCGETTSEWVGPFTFSTSCPTSNPVNLPFVEDFENIAAATLNVNAKICKTNSSWEFETNTGQARFGENAPLNNGGSGALLLDGTGSYNTNNAILTVDMSNYIDAPNIFLSFDTYDAYDSHSPNDSVWIRGSHTEDWVTLYSWQGPERTWITSPEFDIATILADAGQSLSSSFQIRFGQEGRYAYSSDGLAIDNIIIKDCIAPIGLIAKNITTNTANLGWDVLGSASLWDIEWGIKGFIQGNGISVEGVDTNNYDLSNLLPATSFDFYVRSNCGELLTEWAGPYTFTTLCGGANPVTLPFIEDFEGISNITFFADAELCREYGGWSYRTTNGQAEFGIHAARNNGGQGALMLKGGYTNDYINDAILTLDLSNYENTTNLFLVFDFYDSKDDNSDNDKIWIRGNNADKWLPLYDWQGQAENTWITTPDLNLDTILANAGQRFSNSFQIRFGQQGYYPNSSEGLILDNIYVGTCSRPDTLMATNSRPTSVDLGWTETGMATIWDIEYGARGYTQGTGTTITGVASNLYTLPNLAEGTYYDFYVRADCGGTYSYWAGPYTFNTLCASLSPISLPFIENFEQVPDTTFTDTSFVCSSNGNWEHQIYTGERTRFGADAIINNGGTGAMEIAIPSSFGVNDAILTLDMSDYRDATNIILSFDFYNASNYGTYNDSLWIRGNDTNSWIPLYRWDENAENTWITTPEFDIDNALINAGQPFSNSFQIRFGIGGSYARTTYRLTIDNIYLGTCARPDSLAVTNITPTSADLSWIEMGTATMWEIEYGLKNYQQGSGTKISDLTTNLYTLQNLEQGSYYDFYVRANCNGLSSAWVGPFTFNTACRSNPITLPFLEDFESINNIEFTENGLICTIDGTWTYETTGGRAKFGRVPLVSEGESGLLLDNIYNYATNYAILTLDMSNYNNQQDVFLTFDYIDAYNNISTDNRVWVRGNNTGSWQEIYNWEGREGGFWFRTSPQLNISKLLSVNEQNFSKNFQIRFGQRGYYPYFEDGLLLDNITLWGCAEPINLNAIRTTDTSTTLIWSEINTATSWDIKWRRNDFLQGENTVIENLDDTTYTLSGLTPNTTYEFYVRANCDASNSSDWAGPYRFRTIRIYPTNFIENFENFNNPDWDSYNSIGLNHSTLNKVMYRHMDGINSRLYAKTPFVGTVDKGDWLSFNYRYIDYSDPNEPKALGIGDTLNVKISTVYDGEFTIIDQIYSGIHKTSTSRKQLTYDLSDYEGHVIQIQLDATWGTGNYYLELDDFFIGNAEMSIADASLPEGDIGGVSDLIFKVSLDTVYPNSISVEYEAIDSTAIETAGDYRATKGSLTFLPGETEKDIIIPILGDDMVETDEVVHLKLSNPSLTTITDSLGRGIILNDDFNDTSLPESNANQDQLNVCDTIVQLNAILGEMDSSLGWQIISGTGGFLEQELLENAVFTGTMGTTYELEWSVISNPSGTIAQDTMTVSFNPDTDNDGVQDCVDICPNGNDALDQDEDEIPDACDCNPNNANDSLMMVTNNHPDNRIADSTYQSSVKLIGTGTVKNQSIVVFKAGQEILLSAGFHAELGSNFQTLIAPCVPNQNVAETNPIIANSRQQPNHSTDLDALEVTNPIKMRIRPNLIRQAATIQIDLPNQMRVSLRLYNANGQEMQVYLTETFLEEGTHFLPFDSNKLPSGIYFLQLQSEKGVLTKRLLVQR